MLHMYSCFCGIVVCTHIFIHTYVINTYMLYIEDCLQVAIYLIVRRGGILDSEGRGESVVACHVCAHPKVQ